VHFAATEQGSFAQFMIAQGEPGPVAKFRAQFAQTFPRALHGGRVTDTDKAGVTRVIADGDEIIGRPDFRQKAVELPSLLKRVTHPDHVPVGTGDGAEEGIANVTAFVIVAARAFGGAGVVDVAYNGDRDLTWSVGLHAASKGCHHGFVFGFVQAIADRFGEIGVGVGFLQKAGVHFHQQIGFHLRGGVAAGENDF